MFFDFVIFPFSKSWSSKLFGSLNIRITDLLFHPIQISKFIDIVIGTFQT